MTPGRPPRTPALPLLAGAALAIPSLFAPPILWEWRNVAAGRSVAAGGLPFVSTPSSGLLLMHPPGMAYAVGAAIAVFGDHVWAWRLPGLACLLLTAALIWAIALELGLSRGSAWLAAALFSTNPLAVQCALGVDFADGSLLTLGCALFLWASARRAPWSALAAALALCLWSKLPTTVALAAAFTAAAWLKRPARRALWAGALGGGAALFAASWAWYCVWAYARAPAEAASAWELMLMPFSYLASPGAAARAWDAGARSWLLYEASSALYLGIPLLAAAAFGLLRWLRRAASARRLPAGSLVPLFGMACLALYSVYLGGGRAYPKYFQTSLVPLSILAASVVADAEELFSGAGAAWLAGAGVYYAFVVGDYLRVFNFDLRAGEAAGDPRPALARLAVQGALFLTPAAALFWPRRRALGSAAAILILGSQLGLSIAQAVGRYDLRQAYGASFADFDDVVAALRAWPADGPVLADRGVVDAAGARKVQGYGSSSWEDLASIRSFIEEQRPKAVVYGLALNTIDQLRAINGDERLLALLSAGYSKQTMGSFTVWLRLDGARFEGHTQGTHVAR